MNNNLLKHLIIILVFYTIAIVSIVFTFTQYNLIKEKRESREAVEDYRIEIWKRDSIIIQRDAEISYRDAHIAERDSLITELESEGV